MPDRFAMTPNLRRALRTGALITLFSVAASIVPVWIWLQIDPVIDHASIYVSCIVLPVLISPTCSFYVLRARMRAEELARENHRLANSDELTGLPNRRAFFHAAKALQARAASGEGVLVCAIADIDNFKRVNDAFGHEAGDEVIKSVGGVLQACAPEAGFAARLGGEEFALAGLFASELAARAHFSAVVSAVRACGYERIGAQLRVTISLGHAPAGAGETVSAVLSRADRALYQAKHDGKDRALSARDVAETPRERAPNERRARV